MDNLQNAEVLRLTARIVVAFVDHHDIAGDALPRLIRSVHRALATAGAESPHAPLQAAVPIRKSVFPDYIVCLESGRRLQMLKRHLKTSYNMTPNEYRLKWGLPPDYPMVAPAYAARRSALARSRGLGRKPPVAPIGPERATRLTRQGRGMTALERNGGRHA